MKKQILLVCSLGLITGMLSAQNIVWDEDVNGDLSNDFDNPTLLTLVEGGNDLLASQQGMPRDVDYIRFTVPVGFELSAIDIDGFSAADSNNLAFIGIQEGTAFNQDFSSTTAADLLGGKIYGSNDVDFNILPAMGLLNGATGYTGALESGDYVIWLNQTGAVSSAEISFFLEVSDIDTELWDDELDGDLSNNHASPTGTFNLNLGSNFITSIVQGSPTDVDYITFTIPNGHVLSEVTVDDYIVANNANLAFVGIIQGTSFPNNAGSTSASDLLGGKTIGVADINNNILQDMGVLSNAIGFTGNLTAGTYSFWFNQTGASSEIDLDFTVITDPTLSTIDFKLTKTKLFPNPIVGEELNITGDEVFKSVLIYDNLGRKIITKNNINSTATKINVSGLANGLYFASIHTALGVFTKRVIKE